MKTERTNINLEAGLKRMFGLGYAGFLINVDGKAANVNAQGKATDWTAMRRSTIERYIQQKLVGRESVLVAYPEGIFEISK